MTERHAIFQAVDRKRMGDNRHGGLADRPTLDTALKMAGLSSRNVGATSTSLSPAEEARRLERLKVTKAGRHEIRAATHRFYLSLRAGRTL